MKRVYIASKAKHAVHWKGFIQLGFVGIQCRWFQYAGSDDDDLDYNQLWSECLEDVQLADVLICYCAPGDVLKGALVEVGIALGLGKRVILVGELDDFKANGSWWNHAGIEFMDTVADALRSTME